MCAVAYIPCLLIVAGLAISVTRSDPTDPVVIEERRSRITKEAFDYQKYKQICTICKTHVSDQSKHCGECGRCVAGFDHHCKWTNNCIGKLNYRRFLALISALQVLTIFQLAVTIHITFEVLSSSSEKAHIEHLYRSAVGYLVGLMTSGLLSAAVWTANGYLIVLHIWLNCNQITTYQHILKVNKHCPTKVAPREEQLSDINLNETLTRPKATGANGISTSSITFGELFANNQKTPFFESRAIAGHTEV
jgi:hypothetical protein